MERQVFELLSGQGKYTLTQDNGNVGQATKRVAFWLHATKVEHETNGEQGEREQKIRPIKP